MRRHCGDHYSAAALCTNPRAQRGPMKGNPMELYQLPSEKISLDSIMFGNVAGRDTLPRLAELPYNYCDFRGDYGPLAEWIVVAHDPRSWTYCDDDREAMDHTNWDVGRRRCARRARRRCRRVAARLRPRLLRRSAERVAYQCDRYRGSARGRCLLDRRSVGHRSERD